MKRAKRRWAAALLAGALASGASGCGSEGQRDPQRPESVNAALEAAPESLGADDTTITVGYADAVITVHLYEDPRCPYCREFEMTGGGPALNDWIVQRKAKAEYTLASFLDDRVGGSGSKKAVNALRAALEAGKFAEYHAVLYQHQPDEAIDGFTDARLLELAAKVEGLRGSAFDSAVTTMRYRSFVAASQRAYEKAGTSGTGREGPGTPTAEIDGRRIPADYNGVLFSQRAFTSLLTSSFEWATSTS